MNNLIRVSGTQMRHQTATICCIGLQTLNDSRRSLHDHSGCFNGMVYRDIGIVSVYTNQNTRRDVIRNVGYHWDQTRGIIVTFPTNYDDHTDVPFYTMIFRSF